MTEKNHPDFSKKISLIILISLLISGSILGNLMTYLGQKLISATQGLIISGSIIIFAVIYGLWSGNHMKCPDCSAICELYYEDFNKNRKALSRKCNIIWNPGIHTIRMLTEEVYLSVVEKN